MHGLLGDGFELDAIRFRLKSYNHKIIVQWVPGNKDIPGNDLASEVAKEAAEVKDVPKCPVWFHSAASRIESMTKDLPLTHERSREVYKNYSKEKEIKEIKTREDQTMLVKIRSGHSTLFAAYRKRIGRSDVNLC